MTLETAKFLKEDFLQQNSFTEYDKYCPFYKSIGMLRNMIRFHTLATAAVERAVTTTDGPKMTFNVIRTRMSELMYRIASMKFEDPNDGEDAIRARFSELEQDIVSAFRALEDEFR